MGVYATVWGHPVTLSWVTSLVLHFYDCAGDSLDHGINSFTCRGCLDLYFHNKLRGWLPDLDRSVWGSLAYAG